MNVFITIPSFHGKGGVSNYYRTILPFLKNSIDNKISHIEIGGINRTYKLFHAFNDQLRVYKHISNNKVDLIHVNPSLDPKALLRDGMFAFWAKKKKVRVLVFFRGWHLPFESLLEGRLLWFAKKTILNADCFIVLSSAFKEKLRKWGVTAPIYVETTTFDDNLLSDFSIDKKLSLIQNPDKIKILFLSRVEKKKGIFETLEAIQILLKRRHHVSLTIAGDGSAINDVKDYLSKYKLNANDVGLIGYVRGELKKSVFNSHHLFCLPSYGEGMPNAVLEAMAFGMPIVTTRVGGIKDFFVDGKMGFLIEKKYPEVIADLIEKLISAKDKMENMAFYNHQYAMEHFLASKVAMRINKIYKNTILCSK